MLLSHLAKYRSLMPSLLLPEAVQYLLSAVTAIASTPTRRRINTVWRLPWPRWKPSSSTSRTRSSAGWWARRRRRYCGTEWGSARSSASGWRLCAGGPRAGPLTCSPTDIRARLEKPEGFLHQDVARANEVFRETLTPITLTPVAVNDKRFYRAVGEAKGA